MVRLATNLLLLLALGTQALAEHIVIGAGGEGSTGLAYGQALAAEAQRIDPSLTIETKTTGGSFDNLKRLGTGEIDVALATIDAVRKSTLHEGTSVLWAIDNLPVILVVRKSLGIDRISDLKGHRIVPGGAGSSLERTAPEVYERLGAKPQWRRASWGQIGYMLVSNQADGFVGSLTMLESVKSEYGMPELKVIRLSATEIAMLDSMHPDISLGIVMYEGLPVSGWKMRSAVISRNLPSHHAETLAKAAINISLAGPFRDKGRPYRIDESTLDMKVHNHPASLHVLSAQPQ